MSQSKQDLAGPAMNDALNDVASLSIADHPTKFYGWKYLPTEIKIQILGYLTSTTRGATKMYAIMARDHSDIISGRSPFIDFGNVICSGNRQLSELALNTYYKENWFCILMKAGIGKHPQSVPAGKIRYLHLGIPYAHIGNSLEEVLLTRGSGWRALLRPKVALDPTRMRDPSRMDPLIESQTSWQPFLTNLCQLHVDIAVTSAFTEMFVEPEPMADEIIGWLDDTEFVFEAKNVHVNLLGLYGEGKNADALASIHRYMERRLTKSG